MHALCFRGSCKSPTAACALLLHLFIFNAFDVLWATKWWWRWWYFFNSVFGHKHRRLL